MSGTRYDERVSGEAGAWLARLQSDTLSLKDQAAFQNWLVSDPAHAAAFEDATVIWDHLGAVPRSAYIGAEPKRRLDRRAFMAGAATLAIAGTAASFVLKSAKADTYQTAVGEQKQIHLSDGTSLLLDTDTCVSTHLGSDVRLIELKYGRINCRIVEDSRQFAVKTTDKLIVGNGSEFDLSQFNDYFSVYLIKGAANINSVGASVTVSEGERAYATPGQPIRRDKPKLSLLTAWQTGRLTFKDETIGDAAREMNRYNTVKLEINDPQLALKRISGGYRAGDNDSFAQSLARLLPITVIHRNGVIELADSSKS